MMNVMLILGSFVLILSVTVLTGCVTKQNDIPPDETKWIVRNLK